MFGLNDNNEDNGPAGEDKPAAGRPHDTFTDKPKDSSPTSDPVTAGSPAEDKPAAPDDDQLISIKEKALQSLSPLLNHLDQSPEERFKTLMMLIQASDNSGLIKDAYESASKIDDEKGRAQALLDVVNEINYFTQKDGESKV